MRSPVASFSLPRRHVHHRVERIEQVDRVSGVPKLNASRGPRGILHRLRHAGRFGVQTEVRQDPEVGLKGFRVVREHGHGAGGHHQRGEGLHPLSSAVKPAIPRLVAEHVHSCRTEVDDLEPLVIRFRAGGVVRYLRQQHGRVHLPWLESVRFRQHQVREPHVPVVIERPVAHLVPRVRGRTRIPVVGHGIQHIAVVDSRAVRVRHAVGVGSTEHRRGKPQRGDRRPRQPQDRPRHLDLDGVRRRIDGRSPHHRRRPVRRSSLVRVQMQVCVAAAETRLHEILPLRRARQFRLGLRSEPLLSRTIHPIGVDGYLNLGRPSATRRGDVRHRGEHVQTIRIAGDTELRQVHVRVGTREIRALVSRLVVPDVLPNELRGRAPVEVPHVARADGYAKPLRTVGIHRDRQGGRHGGSRKNRQDDPSENRPRIPSSISDPHDTSSLRRVLRAQISKDTTLRGGRQRTPLDRNRRRHRVVAGRMPARPNRRLQSMRLPTAQ